MAKKSDIDFMKFRLLVREFHLYNGMYPLLKDIFKVYKERVGYPLRLVDFYNELLRIRNQGLPVGFVEEEKEYVYKRKGRKKPQVQKHKVKRVVVR